MIRSNLLARSKYQKKADVCVTHNKNTESNRIREMRRKKKFV